MTHVEFKKSALYFHAQTLKNLGEDLDNCFFKPVLEGNKPQVGNRRYIFLFKAELDQMSKLDTSYFEFAKKYDDGSWGPKSPRRELYKLVHNGFPHEYAIATNTELDSFVIPTEELILVMDYTPSTVDLDAPVSLELNFETPEIKVPETSRIFDKLLTEATLGDLLYVLKSLK